MNGQVLLSSCGSLHCICRHKRTALTAPTTVLSWGAYHGNDGDGDGDGDDDENDADNDKRPLQVDR